MDIGLYAHLSGGSPYGPVPISRLERFAISLSPVLDQAGLFL